MKLLGNRWATLAIICIGFLMILIDTTIVNVSIPTIIRDLNASLTDIEWIITGYALSFAALLITFGRLADLYGRKNFFLLGLFVFTAASFFSGEASSATTLIIARLFQGIGGAILSPVSLSILSSTFRGRERAVAFGIWGAVAGIAVAIGPILGGLFTTYSTWRWIFRVNIPIGILGMLAAWLVIQESHERRRHRLDISGMLTSSLGFFFLIFGLIEGQNYGWWKPAKAFSIGSWQWNSPDYSIIVPCFALSLVFLAIFVAIQWYKTVKDLEPAVNMSFFHYASFRYGLVAIAIIALGEFSSLFTIPIFLQSIHGFTPLQSGLAVLPMALAVMVAAPLSGKLVNKLGSKWIISSGIFIECLGLFLLSRLHADTPYTSLILPFIVLGAGIGLAIAQNTQVILSEIPHEQSGSASGVLNTIRQVGTALGIALIGAILSTQAVSNIRSQLDTVNGLPSSAKDAIVATATSQGIASGQPPAVSAPVPAAIANNPAALLRFHQQQDLLASEVHAKIDSGLADAIGTSIRAGSLFVLLGAFLSLLIPNRPPHREEDGATA